MEKFVPKPYKMIGKIQNYAWGTKNESAFIQKYLGLEPQKDLPYAEYWIGVHPKAPSDVLVNDEKISLIDLLKKYPQEILGARIAEKFNNTFPFLLKILSINQALSIQAHPDKKLAEELHAKDPINYPDDNHKPEIAIAIDNLEAIVGLKKLDEVKKVFQENPELYQLLTNEIAVDLENSDENSSEEILRSIYTQIMYSPEEKLEKCINEIKQKLEEKPKLIESEKQFLLQYTYYEIDVGLISLLLFNLVQLKEGEAIFTPAGIPHAYIKGNIVECMANSDNVVRAGLTPKFKDTKTLSKMLVVDSTKSNVRIEEDEYSLVYKTDAREFEVERLKLTNVYVVKENHDLKILLILDGKISITYGNEVQDYEKGDVILIPASLGSFKIIETTPSGVFSVSVPM